LAQPEALTVLRPRRYLERHGAVRGRHFDVGAEGGFHHRQRHVAIRVFSLPAIERMRPHLDDEDQVARRPSPPAGVAGPGDPHAAAVTRPRGDLDLEPFAPHHAPLARAAAARTASDGARALAVPATPGEDHAATQAPHLAAALARGARPRGQGDLTGTVAIGAPILAHEVEPAPRRLEALLEGELGGLLQVLSGSRARLRRRHRAPQDVAEDLLEAGRAQSHLGGEVEAVEAHL